MIKILCPECHSDNISLDREQFLNIVGSFRCKDCDNEFQGCEVVEEEGEV
jgi:transposase-like protein